MLQMVERAYLSATRITGWDRIFIKVEKWKPPSSCQIHVSINPLHWWSTITVWRFGGFIFQWKMLRCRASQEKLPAQCLQEPAGKKMGFSSVDIQGSKTAEELGGWLFTVPHSHPSTEPCLFLRCRWHWNTIKQKYRLERMSAPW